MPKSLAHTQRGLTLTGLVGFMFVAVVGALLFFQLLPAYNEYFAVKTAIKSLVKEKAGTSAPAIRESFARYAEIESIRNVNPEDLDIQINKQGTQIALEYQRKVPLFANYTLLIDFTIQESSAKPVGGD
jgi:hypothetical protein